MASSVSISSLSRRTMPFLAIVRLELHSLAASWLVRLWLAGTVVVALLTLAAGWEGVKSGTLIALLLSPYLIVPWAVVVMILGINPVTGSRLEALSDGILSRPITRLEYLLAAWAARVAIVLAVYLIVMVPAVLLAGFAKRAAAVDAVTGYGAASALAVVALVLTCFVSLGFMTGTVLRRPLLASVILVFVWLFCDLVLHAFSLEEFSTISLDQAIPTIAHAKWRQAESSDAGDTDQVDPGVREVAETLSAFLGQPRKPRGFYEKGDYSDLSLARVVAGYGLITVLAIGLATVCFCWRDL